MIEIVGIGPFVVSGIVIREWAARKRCWHGLRVQYLRRSTPLFGRSWARQCESGRHVCFPARGIRAAALGTPDVIPVCVADLCAGAASVASASIGFTRYAGYLHPLSP